MHACHIACSGTYVSACRGWKENICRCKKTYHQEASFSFGQLIARQGTTLGWLAVCAFLEYWRQFCYEMPGNAPDSTAIIRTDSGATDRASIIAAIQGNGILRIAADHWLVKARPNAKWLEEDSSTGEYTIDATVAMWWMVRFYNITALSSLKAYWYPSLDSMSQSWMDLQADGNLPRRSYTSDQAALVALVAASKNNSDVQASDHRCSSRHRPTHGWLDQTSTAPGRL